jgi:hypothetical protein
LRSQCGAFGLYQNGGGFGTVAPVNLFCCGTVSTEDAREGFADFGLGYQVAHGFINQYLAVFGLKAGKKRLFFGALLLPVE